jgi:serpin B
MRVLRACVCAIGVGLLTAALMPRGAVARDTAQVQALTQAYNASGQGLFQRFAAAPGNIVLSPYSVGTAMAMALSGARGATEVQMAAVLKHRLPRAEIDAANSAALAILNGYDRSKTPPTCPADMGLNGTQCETGLPANGQCRFPLRREGDQCVGAATLPPSVKLLAANALMLTKRGDLVSPEYVALLKDKYAAEVFQNAGLDEINGWVNRKTEGKIDKILDMLDPDSAAVLLNAVYFRARWSSPFDKIFTKDDAFNLSATQMVQVPMMRQTRRYATVARPGYRAVRLPYEISALGMVIVLPDQVDGLGQVSRSIEVDEPSALFAALHEPRADKLVALSMPRFKAAFKAELVAPFRQAGMTLSFEDKADFSGMTGRPPPADGVRISQIVHRALIEVAEESTEAAAATAIGVATVSAAPVRPEQPEVIRVDRPFLFYVIDDATGAVLFQGRITDPRQASASR